MRNDQRCDLRYASEDQATEALVSYLEKHFDVTLQVRMEGLEVGPDAKVADYRIDLIARHRHEPRWIVGFEVKKGFHFMREYAAAIKQAADYRAALIRDPERAPDLDGKRLAAIMVFPEWTGMHDNGKLEYEREADGMSMLAGNFRVGTCGLRKGRHGLTFRMGQGRLWSEGEGWIYNAEGILFGKRRKGGVRANDDYIAR